MLKKNWLKPSVAVVSVLWTITGKPIDFRLPDPAAQITAFTGKSVAHPYLLILAIGFLLGLWIVPAMIRLFHRNDAFEEIRAKLNSPEIRQAKIEFYRLLGRAYSGWRIREATNASLPNSLNEVIDQTAFPDWLPCDEDLATKVKQNQPEADSVLWRFGNDFYDEVLGYLGHEHFVDEVKEPLIQEDEAKLFHTNRQTLQYCWADIGWHSYEERDLQLKALKSHELDRRTPKIVAILGAILHCKLNQTGPGARYLFKVCSNLCQANGDT